MGKAGEATGDGQNVKTIFRGRVLTLNLETVMLPNGASVELELIRHPGAAAVVPLKEDGTVVLIRQYRHATGGFIYEIPAGKLQSSIWTAPGFADEVIHIYKATGLSRGRQQLDRDEVLEVVEMPLKQAIAKIRDGTIRDGKTIVGLQAVFLDSTGM